MLEENRGKFAGFCPAAVVESGTERKEDFGLVLTRYGLERFLYRLSVSPHRDLFVLKGALLLQLWTAETYRPTRDLDLLGRGVFNVSYRKIFSEMCSQRVEDDGLTFLPDTIRVERIREDEAYEGVRVLLEARLGNVRVPLQIDVGLGDTIVPAPEELEYPTLLKFPAPKLHAYPKESVVAEKFEAMVKLGMANSRMKDFYDLSVLAQRFEFESATLAAAIQATFETRRTTLPMAPPLALGADFYELPSKQTQWRAFLRKDGLKADSSLKPITAGVDHDLKIVVQFLSHIPSELGRDGTAYDGIVARDTKVDFMSGLPVRFGANPETQVDLPWSVDQLVPANRALRRKRQQTSEGTNT